MEENKTIVPEEAVEAAAEAVEEKADEAVEAVEEVVEEAAETVGEAVEAVEGEEAAEECDCECCEAEEKPSKKNVGRKIGIAATVGTIVLGAAAYAAVRIFKRK